MEGFLLETTEGRKPFRRLAWKQKIPLVANKKAGRGRTAVNSVSARLAVGVTEIAEGGVIMAVGKWKVFSQMIEDEKNYIVGRVKDDTKPVHSGNVEYLAGHGYTTDREYCERMAKALNGEFDN